MCHQTPALGRVICVWIKKPKGGFYVVLVGKKTNYYLTVL